MGLCRCSTIPLYTDIPHPWSVMKEIWMNRIAIAMQQYDQLSNMRIIMLRWCSHESCNNWFVWIFIMNKAFCDLSCAYHLSSLCGHIEPSTSRLHQSCISVSLIFIRRFSYSYHFHSRWSETVKIVWSNTQWRLSTNRHSTNLRSIFIWMKASSYLNYHRRCWHERCNQ
jgi:hypothetical protein